MEWKGRGVAMAQTLPVLVAGGGIGGLAAALALGADGVWVGTKFIATHEAHTGRGYKEKMVEINEEAIVSLSKLVCPGPVATFILRVSQYD